MLRSPKHRALFIALGLFAFVVAFSFQPKPSASTSESFARNWPVRMDLMADLSGLLPSHEVVQDTLNYYVGEFAGMSDVVNTSWRFDFCCHDEQLATAQNQAFRSTLTASFPERDLRFVALRELQRSDYLQVREVHVLHGLSYGTVDLRLPIPGTDGEFLALDGVAFNLRLSLSTSAFAS